MPFALNVIHPVLMWGLLGLMLHSGYLGLKSSQIRKVGPEERKAMLPLRHAQRHGQLGLVILGPHLFVGLAVAVLVIATACLGPSLQKGAGRRSAAWPSSRNC